MKCKLLIALKTVDGKDLPEGAIYDDPQAFLLVRHGVAIPADAECEQAHGLTLSDLEAVQFAAKRTALGIHPDDFGAYARGEMAGYNADGSPIPGPNFISDDVYEAIEQDMAIADNIDSAM